jgi:hypothetical protein
MPDLRLHGGRTRNLPSWTRICHWRWARDLQTAGENVSCGDDVPMSFELAAVSVGAATRAL